MTDHSVGFRPPCWCPCTRAPAWRLHTNLYKFGENVSPHIFRKKNCCDLNLGESLCLSTFVPFPDSRLTLLNGSYFLFRSILNGVTLKTSNTTILVQTSAFLLIDSQIILIEFHQTLSLDVILNWQTITAQCFDLLESRSKYQLTVTLGLYVSYVVSNCYFCKNWGCKVNILSLSQTDVMPTWREEWERLASGKQFYRIGILSSSCLFFCGSL